MHTQAGKPQFLDNSRYEKGDILDMFELDPKDFGAVRNLLRPFDYSLSVQAFLEGNNLGRLFVDDAGQPRTVLAITGEGTFLAGDDRDPTVIEPLRRLLQRIFAGTVFPSAEWCIALNVHPGGWVAQLPKLVPTHEADALVYYHYLCRGLGLEWRARVPEGYAVQRVDRAALTRLSEEVREWINIGYSWGTMERFLSKGISFCVAHGDTVVSCCRCNCVAGDQMEIAIFTPPAYRRQGLATVAVAATVECCLNSGYRAVGWHCVHDNVGSWKTAEKVGFERQREYPVYYYIFELPDHLSQLAWSCFKRGEYAKTTQYYEQVFSLRDDHPDYYYNCAAEAWGALGNREMALKYLGLAADNGWNEVEYTSRVGRFRFLHGTPEWEALLTRIRRNVSVDQVCSGA